MTRKMARSGEDRARERAALSPSHTPTKEQGGKDHRRAGLALVQRRQADRRNAQLRGAALPVPRERATGDPQGRWHRAHRRPRRHHLAAQWPRRLGGRRRSGRGRRLVLARAPTPRADRGPAWRTANRQPASRHKPAQNRVSHTR
jgi:hypothetical protein